MKLMENERFVTIKDFPLYEISNYGNVRRNVKLLKPYIIRAGKRNDSFNYLGVGLYKNGIRHRKKIHRLVAEHFLPFEPGYKNKFVNHKDLNKQNNYFENLEWMTCQENTIHAIRLKNQWDEMERMQIEREKSECQYTPVYE